MEDFRRRFEQAKDVLFAIFGFANLSISQEISTGDGMIAFRIKSKIQSRSGANLEQFRACPEDAKMFPAANLIRNLFSNGAIALSYLWQILS